MSTTEQQKALIRRRASVQTGMFAKLLHDKDPETPSKNSGAWIISLTQLESNPGLELCRATIREKIVNKYVRFRSRLSFNSKYEAEFEELEELDWDYHMPDLSTELPVMSMQNLFAYIGDLTDFEYDLDKPLWRYLLIPKLEDGTCAMVFCINHALGDGLSLVAVADGLYDEKPMVEASLPITMKKAKSDAARVEYPLSVLSKIGIFLYGVFHGLTLQFSKPDEPNALRMPPGRKALGKKRIAAAKPIPLDKIKEIKTKLMGTTVNDVLMTLMNLALQRFFESKEGSEGFSPEHRVTAQFPISMRGLNEGGLDLFGEPHNKISYAYFGFDFKAKSRIDLVWSVKHQIDCIKYSPAPLVLEKSLRLAFRILPHKFVMDTLDKVGNLGTAQLSNVPASQTPVTSFGIRVLDMSFYLFSPLAVYLGILTYNNMVNASFNLDSGLQVDPTVLAECWNEEFELLYKEVMQADDDKLKRPRPPTAFYKRVALSTMAFLLWFVLLVVFGLKPAVFALFGVLCGVAGMVLTRDD